MTRPGEGRSSAPPNPASNHLELNPDRAEASPDASLPDSSGQWQTVLQRVKAQRPYLASYLEQGILISLTEEELVIGYPKASSFFVDLIHKEENLTLITSTIKECLQKALKFRVILVDPSPGMERPAHLPKSDIHPVVKEALKILGGEIVDPKP
jgi:hypothetical protein